MLDFYKFKHFENTPHLIHVVSTKSSTLPYSFSLALHTGEDKKNIISNRHYLAKQLQVDTKLHFIVAQQTHSDNIQHITEEDTKGWEGLDDAIESCDALITNIPNVVLSILTADCVPILLYDTQNHAIAAIHAGWKGTKTQITQQTVKKMQEVFGTEPSHIIAGMAPSIGRCCYEVGEDVAKHFFDMPEGYTQVKNKYMLDLPYINQRQLLQAGILEKNIEMSGICTACHTERFFSYRKEEDCSGRFMSMIALKDKK